MECWRLLIDTANPKPPINLGWPKTIRYTDNYGREPVAHLPNIKITGMKNPVIQLKDSKGELVYALRIKGSSYRPPVFDQEESYEFGLENRIASFGKPSSRSRPKPDSPSSRIVKF